MITALIRDDGTIICTAKGSSQTLKANRVEIPFDIPAEEMHEYRVIDQQLHKLVEGEYVLVEEE